MTEAIRRLGRAYGKLGLSTDPALIGRRAEGVKAASGELKAATIAALVQAAFDIGAGEARFAFLSHFEADPTFGVQPADREAILLAGAVAEQALEDGIEASSALALAIVTCASGGLRKPPLNEQLVEVGRHQLALFQGRAAPRPKDRTYSKQPKALTEAIAAVPAGNMQNIAQVLASVKAALEAIGNYAEVTALAAASSDGELLRYSHGLEEEMHVYWWVTGGWSDICGKPFRQLPLALAAVCAGQELVSKHSSAIGLFAAPALIDLLLERGRTSASDNVPFRDAATLPALSWRKERFAGTAAKPLAALMPVTTALGLAAASEDAGDWEPRFERLTGLKPDAVLPAAELGLQLYRELLVARSLDG